MKRRMAMVAAATTAAMALTGCATGQSEGTHPNEQMVREGYAAFNNRDMETVLALFADGITFIVPGRSLQAGTFRGKGEVQRYFSLVGRHTAGTHSLDIQDVVANDRRVVVLVRGLGTHEDKVFDQLLVHSWKVRDGKFTELHLVPTDQYAFDEFWS
ncbi:MAG TPA: nuclear transport factor 2 family protein [Actinomycetota bacterium]|nr:nuclear transport factor 2 family protein [Actinomycetota bacterium]